MKVSPAALGTPESKLFYSDGPTSSFAKHEKNDFGGTGPRRFGSKRYLQVFDLQGVVGAIRLWLFFISTGLISIYQET